MGQEVFTYDVNGIKLAKGKDPKVTLAPVVDNGTRVASIDPDDGQVITDPANQAFALAQPSPTAPDTLNPAQRAALALVADDPATREERKTTVAVNLPAFTFEKQG